MKLEMTSSPRQMASRLGVPGALGLVLVLGSAGTWWTSAPARRAELDALQDQVTQLRQQLQAGASSAGSGQKVARAVPLAVQAQAAWQALWRALPSQAQAAGMQTDVMNLARAQGLSIQSVQYGGGGLKALPGVWRQQMSLPVEAPYPVLRAWLAQLQRQPALSIDALDISRADPMSEQVKAKVSLSLWWRLADQGQQP